jgi:hypothetical protein
MRKWREQAMQMFSVYLVGYTKGDLNKTREREGCYQPHLTQ